MWSLKKKGLTNSGVYFPYPSRVHGNSKCHEVMFLRAWDPSANGILKSCHFKTFNLKSVIIVDKNVRRIICKLSNCVDWIRKKYFIYIYIHMCIDIIPTKWERTRLEIISKLSLLSFLTSSSFPSSVLGKGRSWEQTAQGEEFMGGTKWTRLETAWSTRQYLLTGTTTVTGRQKQYHTPAKPSVYSNISSDKKSSKYHWFIVDN